MKEQLREPRSPPLNYEAPAQRVPVAVPVSLCITLTVCGTALVLAPWLSDAYRFLDAPSRSVPIVLFTGLTLGLGLTMIALGYWHARH